jgi:hypothetical protein
MQKTTFKYFAISVLALLFFNRALFYSPYEIENNGSEINSVLELVLQYFTGHDNGIDEDGNLQESCHIAKIIQPFFSQQFSNCIDLQNKFSLEKVKFIFSVKENIPTKPLLGTIDHPPQG